MADFTAGGSDAEFNIDINVDVNEAQAAAEFARLAKALATAMRSPEVQKSVQSIVQSFQKVFSGTTKTSAQTWRTVQTQGVAAAHKIGSAFDDVARKSKAALSANQARGSSNELQALNALVASLAGNFEHLATDVRTTNTVLKEMSAGARAQLAAVTQEQRTLQQQLTSQNATLNTQAQERANKLTNATKLQLADIRAQSAADRNASNERIANIRRFTQIATSSIRALTQIFRTTFNAATNIVRGFVNTAGAIIRGLAGTFRGVFNTINGIVRSFVSGFTRAFSTIGRGVSGALAGVSRTIRSALSRDEAAVKDSMSRRERAMSASAGRQQSIFSRAGATLGLLGGGAAVGSLLTSGFERAGQVEQLQLTFNALLGDSGKATSVLQSLSEYARTTSFDFVEVAQSTAQLTAALGDVDKAQSLTKFLGDVVALTGGTTESLGRVRLAMSQIAGAGRLDSANLRQITESLPGVPIAQILADKFFGGSVEAYSAARDAGELGGKISAEAFFTAFQEGTQERFPEVEGFAQVAAGTLTGMTQNLKENFAIFGATIIDLVKGPLKAGIGGLNEFLDLAGKFVSGSLFSTTAGTTPYGATITKPLTDNLEKLKLVRDILGKVAVALGALLAFKGVFAVLGYGIRLALSPLGLLVIAVTGVVAAWSIFMKVSERFAQTWKVVTYQFKPAIDAVIRLGRAFKGAFSGGGGGDGKPSILTRIGDAMRYVNVALGRLLVGFRNFANVLSDGLELKGFKDFGSTLDAAAASGLASIFFGTKSQEALDKAKAEGGSQLLNLLEETFLGPVVRFFRGPFLNVAKSIIGFISNIVGQIASAVGDIWGIIFGKDKAADGATPIDAIFGTQDQRSTGTKILDRLEETFLGPVVRFFRGPFADAIEGIGGFIGGLFENYLIPGFKGVFNFFAHDFIPGIVSVAQSIGNFLSPAVHTVGDLLGQVGTLLAPIGGAIQGFVEKWKTEGVAAAFSSLWDGVVEAAGNLWEGTDGNGGIKAGLESAITSITSWFSTTFTGKNVEGWIKAALDGIRKVGYAIGKVIGSPEFLGTIIISAAAIAAAVAAVIGAFGVGLAQGLAKEGLRWGKLIAGAVQDGWNALAKGALSFVPDPVAAGISAMLGSPIIGTGIAAALALTGGLIVKGLIGSISTAATRGGTQSASFANVGIGIASGLFNSVVSGFSGVGKGARSLFSYILPRFGRDDNGERTTGGNIASRVVGGMSRFFGTSSPLAALRTRMSTGDTLIQKNFGSVGTGIATAIIGGIAAYEMGSYAGKTGSGGKVILALLGGAATGGSIGAAIGGLPGAAIGALVGTALAGVGAALGASGEAAKKATGEINEYRDALIDLADTAGSQDLAVSTVLTNLQDENQKVNEFLVDAKFNVRQAVSDVFSGDFNLGTTFNDLLNNFLGGEAGANLTPDLTFFIQDIQGALNEAMASGKPITTDLFEELIKGIPNGEALLGDLKDAGFDVVGAFDAIQDETNELAKGVQLREFADQLDAVAQGAEKLDTVAEALQALHDGLAAGDTAAELAAILSNGDLSSTNALQALSDAAGEVADQLDKAKEAFQEALEATRVGVNDTGAKTFEGITDKVIGDLPQIASGFQQIFDDFNNGKVSLNIDNVIGQSQLRTTTEGFKNQLTGIIQDAVGAGLVTDDASLDTFLTDFKNKVDNAGLDDGITEMLDGIINAFINGDYSSTLDPVIAAMTDQSRLAEAGRLMAQRVSTAFGSTFDAAKALGGPAALGSAIGTGTGATTIKPPTIDLSTVIDSTETARIGREAGEQIGDAVPPGFAGSGVTEAMKTELNATGDGLHSTAATAGQKVGVALVKGVGTGTAGMAQVGLNAGRSAAKGAAGGASEMYSIGQNAGAAFSRGILSQVSAAARSAAAIARAATQSAKTALKIKSPSLVFQNIGKQVGEGFVKGIQDSTVSMTDALSTALETAIKTAVEKSSDAVNKANVAGKLFETLQPSTLPGGTSNLDVSKATTDITSQVADFLPDLRSGISDALGSAVNDGLREAVGSVAGIRLDVAGAFTDLRGQFADATAAKKAIDDYNKSLANLKTQLQNGTLATVAASRERGQAYKDLIDDQNVLNDKIARLRVQLNNGTIAGKNAAERLATFNEKVKDLKDSFSATSVEHYHEELDRINRAYKNGTLAQQEYRDQLDKLGSRPSALTFDQSNLLASGTGTLSLGTIAGKANSDTLSDALTKIRDWGQAALDAGTALPSVITSMETYVKNLRTQATAAGLAAKDVDALIKGFGLTDTQLKALQATVFSLNTATVSGAENVAKINEQLSGLRDYAQALLTAGNTPDSVITKVKQLRDALVAQAKSFGFNATGIEELVKAAGLSDSALADFIKQLNDYTAAVKGAAQATPDALGGNGVSRPISELHVHVPYGDPEAVALATANRLAYDSLTSWS